MATTKNLCAQISLDLHQKISEGKEAAGLTTAQYITELLTEYFKMKENGGKTTMANNSRTMAFQIPEDLFQRIKAHLERETQRTGRKLTQREFVLGLIEEALEAAERQAVEDIPEPEEEQLSEEAGVSPCEAQLEGSDPSPRRRTSPPCGARNGPCEAITTEQRVRSPQSIPITGMLWGLLFVSPEEGGESTRNKMQPFASQTRRWRPPRGQICRTCWSTWATASAG